MMLLQRKETIIKIDNGLVEGDEIRLICYELFVYIDIFSNSENIKWKKHVETTINTSYNEASNLISI